MGKLFIVDGANCLCKFGSAPGRLKVTSQQLMVINANKKIATSLDLLNSFYPPAFGTCNCSSPSKPCVPNIIKWSNLYDKMRLPGAYPLMPDSKATCALSGAECVEILQHGQVQIFGSAHIKNATASHQNDLDPSGNPLGLSEEGEEAFGFEVTII